MPLNSYDNEFRNLANDDENFYFRDYTEDEDDSGEIGKLYALETTPKKLIFKLNILSIDLLLYSDSNYENEKGEIEFKGTVYTKLPESLLYKINAGFWAFHNNHLIIGIYKLGLFLAEPVSEIDYDYSVVIYPYIDNVLKSNIKSIIENDSLPKNSELYLKWDDTYNKLIEFYEDDKIGLNEFLKTKNLFI